jgi:cell filamentation protein
VSIAKESVFCPPQHLDSYAADAFGRLTAADRLPGLNREQFITRLAEFLADVNALHPFREGNGRAQRAFFSQLTHDAGHHIDWIRMDPDRNTTASAAAHHGDLAPLIELLGDLIDLPHPPGPAGGYAALPARQIPGRDGGAEPSRTLATTSTSTSTSI